MTELAVYIKHFASLNRAPGATWTEAAKRKAPHKPLLLLAALDLVPRGVITSPFIAVTGDLVELNELFNLYWRRIIPLGQELPSPRRSSTTPHPSPTCANTPWVPSWTRGCSTLCRAVRGGRFCCLDLADAEGYTPRNTPNFQHLYAVTCDITYGSNQNEVLHDRP